jgi:MFS transporter, DHA2 family, multidrug resistance protein
VTRSAALNHNNSNLTAILLVLTVTLAGVIETLDLTVTNIALPHLMAQFNVRIHLVTWVTTAYITSSAVITLLVGKLIDRLGQKRLLLVSTLGFCICSLMCGLSTSFATLVLFRTLQGIFGASLAPVGQYIILGSFDKKTVAPMACWAGGILLALIFGPVIGAYVISILSWRWIFFINLPIGVLVILLTYLNIEESNKLRSQIDVVGFALMTIAVVGFEIVLSEGPSLYWLHSRLIAYLSLIVIGAGILFVLQSLNKKEQAIINLQMLADRKFINATLVGLIYFAAYISIGVVLPVLEQKFLGYSVLLNGLLAIPSGITCVIGIAVSAIMLKSFDARYAMATGVAITAAGAYLLSKATLNTPPSFIILTYLIRGFGLGATLVSIATVAPMNVTKKQRGQAVGLFNFARNIGGSIGICFSTASVNWLSQRAWHHMTHHITPFKPGLHFWLAHQNVAYGLARANSTVLTFFASEVGRRSFVSALQTILFWSVLATLSCLVFTFLVGKASIKKADNSL